MNELLVSLRTQLRAQWATGKRLLVETLFEQYPQLHSSQELALDLIYSEVLLRQEFGEPIDSDSYLQRFPQYAEALQRQLLLHELLHQDLSTLDNATLPVLGEQPTTEGEPLSTRLPCTHPPGYRLLQILGRGGRGVVYRARQLSLGRAVAIKMLCQDEFPTDEKAIALLRREAEVLAQLSHPDIVQVYELGEHQGQCYLAMELLPGGTLAERLAQQPLPPRQAAAVVEVLARAVHAAHLCGIVHRDLKPGNILLTSNGDPKVADFGLAKMLGKSSSLIPSVALVGTPNYMAPEQAEAEEVGPTVDVYGLGAILHETLTGQPPFKGSTILSTLNQVRFEEPPPLPRSIPRDLDVIRRKCLSKSPQQRYPSAEALADDLRCFLKGEPILARPQPWWRRRLRSLARRPALTLTVLFTLGVALFLTTSGWKPSWWDEMAYRRAASLAWGGQPHQREANLVGPSARKLAHRWRFGQGWVKQIPWTADQGSIKITSQIPSVVELLPQAPALPYRIEAELRQDNSFNPFGDLGIVFAHRQFQQDSGIVHLFARAAFSDVGTMARSFPNKKGEMGSLFRLELWILHHKQAGEPETVQSRRKQAFYLPPHPGDAPGPWRTLIIEVHPRSVQASLDTHKVSMNWDEVESFLTDRQTLSTGLLRPGFGPSPEGGIGLHLYGSSLSLRKLKVTKLPPNP